jgi:hypothetical protein
MTLIPPICQRIIEPISRSALTIVLVLALLGSLTQTAQAGLFGALLRKSDDVAMDAGKYADNLVPSLEDGKWLTRQLATPEGGTPLALVPEQGGGWRLIDARGEAKNLNSLDDLSASLADAKVSAGKSTSKLQQIAIREEDFFKLRSTMPQLPEGTALSLVRKSGKSYPLKSVSIGPRSRLVVELEKNMLLNPSNARVLDANFAYLRKGVNKANLKIASFDSKTAATASRSARLAAQRVLLNGDQLVSSLAGYKNQTLMITGRIETDAATKSRKLIVKDGSRKRVIDLDELDKIAESQRVNLMIVETNSLKQPGKGGIFKTALEKQFKDASQSITQKDLLSSLAPPKSVSLIHASENGSNRIVMTTSYAAQRNVSKGNGQGSDYSFTAWSLHAGTTIGVHSLRINSEDPKHTEEVEGRWISWISNIDLILSVVGLVVYGFVSLLSWKWWKAIWRFFGRRSVDEEDFGKPIRIIRLISFLPISTLFFLPAVIWIWIRDVLGLILWPFRKIASFMRP